MAADFAVIREGGVERHGNQLFVTALIVFHQEDTYRTDLDDGSGNDRRTCNDKRIQRIPVFAQRMWYEAIVCGIAHWGVQNTIYKESAARLVEFIFDWLAPNGNFDQDVECFGRIVPRGDQVDSHNERPLAALCAAA